MAQSPTVMAFRKRLAFRGYSSISIYRLPEYVDRYEVRAYEPLANKLVIANLSVGQMNMMFR